MNTTTYLCGHKIDNPIIPASGTFGFGQEYREMYDLNILGAISIKGTTREARFGNPTPRIAECKAGMLNAVGLQNPGVEAVVGHELPELAKIYRKPIIANVCGFSLEEYVEVARRMCEADNVGWIELNVSCPNVKHGGMSFGTDAGCQGSVLQTCDSKVVAQCYGHSSYRPSLPRGGSRRIVLNQYSARYAARPSETSPHTCKYHGWILGRRRIPRCSENGISGSKGVPYTDSRLWRHKYCSRCRRDDDGRSLCRRSRYGKPHQSIRLQRYNRRVARCYAAAQNR